MSVIPVAVLWRTSGGKKEGKKPYDGPGPTLGAVYEGRITGVHAFGVIVMSLAGREEGLTMGLYHRSKLETEGVTSCRRFVDAFGGEEEDIGEVHGEE